MTIGCNEGNGGYSDTSSSLLILLPESWEQGCTHLQSRMVRETYMERGRMSLNR